jgi:thiol:disulfide interchange protein
MVYKIPLKPLVAGQALPDAVPYAWTATGLRLGGRTFSLEARGDVPVTRADAPKPATAPERARRPLSAAIPAALLAGLAQIATPAVLALLAALVLSLRSPAPDAASPRERLAALATGVVAGSWIVAGVASWALRAGYTVDESMAAGDPAVGAGIAALAFVLALNLWGFLPLPVPGRGKGGTARLLIGGLFAAPLALAWPLATLRAPFEDGRAHGPATLAALLATAGLGLALPLLLGVALPGLLGLLGLRQRTEEGAAPDASHWPIRLRTALGFVAAAGLIHLLALLARQVRSEGIAFLELTLLAASLFAWLLGRQRLEPPPPSSGPHPGRLLCALAFLLCLAAAPWIAERYRFTPRPTRTLPAPVQPVEPLV